MTALEWDETVLALQELLRHTAERVVSQAPLYNAAKHGLVGVPGEIAKWAAEDSGGERIVMAEGRGITYLLREYPARTWAAEVDIVDIESDFLIVQALAIAVHNLWAIARRNFLAFEGVVYPLDRRAVDRAFLAAAIGKNHVAQGIRVALHEKVDPSARWGEGIGAAKYRLNIVRVSDEVLARIGSDEPQTAIEGRRLPLRESDRSPFTGGSRFLFMFTPKWASAV
jgi:hypothetical protein